MKILCTSVKWCDGGGGRSRLQEGLECIQGGYCQYLLWQAGPVCSCLGEERHLQYEVLLLSMGMGSSNVPPRVRLEVGGYLVLMLRFRGGIYRKLSSSRLERGPF